ncbi:hypothetical protein GCM10011415_24600 [Salipiger pallidus]|uniref:Uncharacterized protein n=1 Tax=Salipiger pallidus TaxID=1775170 RepID=A0A8J2ZKW7_9RHOB|nr:hypothetical protein [Salipiger pallidus]GGG75136.1 hypothetical protein GCM10011415_24600 [Salipiger pallidus]
MIRRTYAMVLFTAALGAAAPGLAAAQGYAQGSTGVHERNWTLSIGRPVTLTRGEKSRLAFLMPRADPASITPEQAGRVRGILHSNRSDSNKRSRLRMILRN